MSLTTPADFVSALRAHEVEPVTFCTYLLHAAAAGDGTVTPEHTATEFDIHNDAASHLLDLAAEFGILNYTSPTSNQVTVNRSTTTKFIQFLDYFDEYATEREIDLLASDSIHDVELTVAVPDEFEGQDAELMARLIRLVRNAETELLVVTPFFTRFGIDVFVHHLAQATAEGTTVTVLTRDVGSEEGNQEHVQRIHETVADTGDLANLHLLEYDSPHGHLHAKALIADRTEAYVGSANFTNYSLKEAIEIGLIVRGPVVKELTDFFALVQNATETRQITQI